MVVLKLDKTLIVFWLVLWIFCFCFLNIATIWWRFVRSIYFNSLQYLTMYCWDGPWFWPCLCCSWSLL
jgi:hypothetical protein